jgi:conjugative transposon TraM protein
MKNMSTNNEKNASKELKQKMKKFAVFALMGVIFAGCLWFIFKPSESETAAKEAQSGFNTDIPMPKDETLIGDKRDAYEQELLQQQQTERMRTLDNFSSLLGKADKYQSDEQDFSTDEDSSTHTTGSRAASMQNSMDAYHDINRTLGSFYETPTNDTEKEEVQSEIEELRRRLDEKENRKNAIEEQMTLMEKSFQMAAKYLPNAGTAATTGTETTTAKPPLVPVSGWIEQTVSALPQETSESELLLALSRPRNMGFVTPTSETSKQRKNTIFACIHANQTVMDGDNVRLRLTEPIQAGSMVIRENTVLSGFAKIQGERLQITIQSLEFEGSVIPVEILVYDTDGQCGIFIPNTHELNAAKEIVAGMGTNLGTSISLADDAGKQLAADMGRSVIQGTSQFLSKKLREVKVNLKAGYKVLLLPNDK